MLEALDHALNGGKVRRKANATADLLAKAARVVRGSPEVMVKITGFGKGASHVAAHLSYISRSGKLALETDRGEVLDGKSDLKGYMADWAAASEDSRKRRDQRDTVHIVLSMPAGTPDEAVRAGARQFGARHFGANHEYVFALHTDEPHPHVHMTVRLLGFDGKRLDPRKDDLRIWREGFAQAMRDEGIDAEATPRAARGVVRKAERSVLRHIERGDQTHEPRVSRVRALQVREVVQQLIAEQSGAPLLPRPWEDRIRARRLDVRDAWLRAADSLDFQASGRSDKPIDRTIYDNPNTARTRTVRRAAALHQSHLERDRVNSQAVPVASLRNLSGLGVVQHERPTQVLLLPDASDRLGRDGGADHAVRRAGVGAFGTADGPERMNGLLRNGDLPETIRRFVDKMPRSTTLREERAAQLAERVRGEDLHSAAVPSSQRASRDGGPIAHLEPDGTRD